MIVSHYSLFLLTGRGTYGFGGYLGTLDSAWIPEEGSFVIKGYERMSRLSRDIGPRP